MRITRFAQRALACAAVLGCSPLFAQTTAVGTTAGQFEVDAMGAATYTIPITVPPGIGGVAPQLAIEYSSQAGNGPLGLGFALSGHSQISRCNATLDQDGYAGGINFTSTDRFCLDGQRLVAVSGAYGAAGTEYRTEVESFSKVISYGGSSGDPAFFRVWSKAGLVTEYGNTADSRIEAQGKTQALVWAQNRTEDTSGNAMTYSYSENNASGEFVPATIEYGISGGTAYSKVIFSYTPRSDVSTGYTAGSLGTQSLRLSAVSTYANGNFTGYVRQYSFAYDQGGNNARSRLVSLTECAPTACLPATRFSWQPKPANGFASATAAISNAYGAAEYTWAGDFNGDGLSDIASASSGNVYMKLASPTGGFTSQTWTAANQWGSAEYTRTGDFNGDGRMDIASFSGGSAYMKLSTGSGFVSQTWPVVNAWGGSGFTWVADFNGDGQSDIASASSGNVYMKLSTGSGFVSQTWPVANLWETSYGEWTRIGDFNGDGLADIASMNAGNVYIKLSAGNSFISQTWPVENNGWSSTSAFTWVADFNGDGLSDIASIRGTWFGNFLYLKLSTGNGFVPQVSSLGYDSWGYDVWTRIGDFNGDGVADIVSLSSGNAYMKLSTGSGFITSTWPVDATYNSTPGLTYAEDFNGDGVTDIASPSGASAYTKIATAGRDLVGQITNGLGAQVQIDYKLLTDPSVYTKGTGAVYPNLDIQAPMSVVSEQRASDGVGGLRRVTYQYSGARANLRGRGMLGFATRVVTDQATGVREETRYSQSFPFSGTPTYVETSVNGRPITRITSTLQSKALGSGRYFPYVSSTTEDAFENDTGALVTRTVTASYYDEPLSVFHGNLSRSTVNIHRGGVGSPTHTTSTTNQYQDDEPSWHLGRLTRTTVTKQSPGGIATRTSAFEYDAVSGLLSAEIIEPDDTSGKLKLRTEYTRTANGMVRYTTVKGALTLPDRVSRNDYDSRGQFVIGTVNPLNHQALRSYDRNTGNPLTGTSPNGLVTSWTYDPFGRITGETRPGGTFTTTTRRSCAGATPACATGAVLRIEAQGSDGSRAWTDFDLLEREVGGGKVGFDGTPILWRTEYNARGEVARKSNPYFLGDPVYWTDYSYDAVGRVLTQKAPGVQGVGVRTTSFDYNGFLVTQTDPLGRRTIREVNEIGKVSRVTDPAYNATTYAYDAYDNLLSTTDPNGNRIVNTYDIRGRKLSTNDPDLGLWAYEYNHFGELTRQTDAKGQVQTLTYDKLGRTRTRVEPEGTTTWTWDTLWKGALTQVTAPGGYVRTHSYDSLGRPRTATYTIAGGSYAYTTAYDGQSRVAKLTYPQGVAVGYAYNARGYLARAEDQSTATATPLWTGDAQDALGNWTLYRYGNGAETLRSYDPASGYLTAILSAKTTASSGGIQSLNYAWDAVGNLTRRVDQRQYGLFEDFTYDAMDRLTRSVVSPLTGATDPVVTDLTLTYDALGNIATKSGAGTYSYGTRPHAVTSVAGNRAGAHTYDANGNLLTSSAPARTLTWTSYNLPRTIAQGGNSSSFDYGPEREKTRQTSVRPATDLYTAETLVYAGGLFEKYVDGAAVSYRSYVQVMGQPIAQIIQSGATRTIQYFHHDHRDSIEVVTNATAGVDERMAYDAFGLRRELNWLNDPQGLMLATDHKTDYGYTGQEHLDHVSLIHMGGRVYDPILGRFTSPDPYVQFPESSQGFNRYSYVHNNPLSNNDPSGFFLKKLTKRIGRELKRWERDFRHEIRRPNSFLGSALRIAGAVGSGFCGPYYAACAAGSEAIIGRAQGVTGSDLLRNSAIAAGAAYGSNAVGGTFGNGTVGNVVAHGAVGGLTSVAQGGNFGQGFLAGSVAAGSGALGLRTGNFAGDLVIASVVGGTASELGGGKFGNGAVTGAFGYLFNEAMHRRLESSRPGSAFTGQEILTAGDGAITVGAPCGPGTVTCVANGTGGNYAYEGGDKLATYSCRNSGGSCSFVAPGDGENVYGAAGQIDLFYEGRLGTTFTRVEPFRVNPDSWIDRTFRYNSRFIEELRRAQRPDSP